MSERPDPIAVVDDPPDVDEGALRMDLWTAFRRLDLEVSCVVFGCLLFLSSLSLIVIGTCVSSRFSLRAIAFSLLGAVGLWLLIVSIVLLVSLRAVGDRRPYVFPVTVSFVLVNGVLAWFGGMAAAVGCGLLGARFFVDLPVVGRPVPFSALVFLVCFSTVFAVAITVFSGRRWSDVPRVAMLPLSVTLFWWFAVAAISSRMLMRP